MARKSNLRRGDRNGDTRPVEAADSTVLRRPRKTKAPAKVEGCEYRWSPTLGWRWRARMKVGGAIQTGEWGTLDEAKTETASMRERQRSAKGITFVTLEQACQDVLDSVKRNEGTWRSYEEHFVRLCAFFGADEPLHAITPARIEEFLTARRAARVRGKPPSDGRLRKHLVALGRVFRFAIRRKRFAGANPLDQVERPKAGKRRHRDVFAVDELVAMFTALRARTTGLAPWDAAVVAGLLFTGLRREGLCRVTVSMIDQQAGFVRELEQKESLGSVVPITRPLAHVLPVLIAAADETGHLIPKGTLRGPRKKDGRPRTDVERRTSTVDRVFRRCRGDLPEPLRARFHPHAMRHTLRTILADSGVPEHFRDAFTDHAPSTIGRGYEHASPAGVRAWAAKVLDPLLWIVDPAAERPPAVAL